MKQASFLLLVVINGVFFCSAARALDDNIWPGVDSWVYQLQNADINDLSNTTYDVVVIDYAKDGTDDTAYTREQIQSLQASGKIVLAYLSIGEAEDYRFYWQNAWVNDPPAWLGPENQNWTGNYKVKYWDNGWWDTGVQPYLNRIEAAGFDGVYLDIIDGYEYWGNHGYGMNKSANRMVKLIKRIRGNLASQNQSVICPQNGEAIIDDASKKYRQLYWENTNCLGIEDLFYHSTKSDRTYRKKLLKRFAKHNTLMLNVEYIKPAKAVEYFNQAAQQEFPVITYRAEPDRELDTP